MRVKICGITSFEDAIQAINAGANALGFVFYEKSPRYITPFDAKEIIKKLPPFIEKVGLFVNNNADEINQISQESAITLVQLHFECDTSLTDQLNTPFIHVVRASKPEDILLYANQYRIVDAYCEAYGGIGKRINLEWFEGIDCSKIILAGGLDPHNAKETLPFNFYGLDVSSGVEQEKGKKDPQRVTSFIKSSKRC